MKGLDILQRGMTLSLFTVTLVGAYFTANGSYNIVSRRIASPPASSQPVSPPTIATESKKT